MRPHPLAKRYATAIFQLASERNRQKEIVKEVQEFATFLEENDKLRAFLFSPEIEKKAKFKVIDNLIKSHVSELFYHFLLLLVKKERQTLFPSIQFELTRLDDIQNNRIRAKVTTAIALEEENLELIKKLLTESFKSKVILENVVETDILGGMIIRIDGKVVDGSLRHQLSVLAQKMRQAKLNSI